MTGAVKQSELAALLDEWIKEDPAAPDPDFERQKAELEGSGFTLRDPAKSSQLAEAPRAKLIEIIHDLDRWVDFYRSRLRAAEAIDQENCLILGKALGHSWAVEHEVEFPGPADILISSLVIEAAEKLAGGDA